VLDAQLREGLDYLGEKRITDFRDEQAKDPTPPANQRPRVAVRVIADLFDEAQHSSSENWAYRRHAVYCSRHGCGRNLRKSRDINLIQTFTSDWSHRCSQRNLFPPCHLPKVGERYPQSPELQCELWSNLSLSTYA